MWPGRFPGTAHGCCVLVRVALSNRRSRLPHGSSPSAEIVFFARVKTEIFPKEKVSPIFHQENGDDRSL